MNFQLIYLLATIAGSVFILTYLWRNQNTHGSKPLAWVCTISIVWITGEVIGVVSDSFANQFLGETIRFAGVVSLPVALLTFIGRYCGRKLRDEHVILLAIIPSISWLTMITTLNHNLFFATATTGALGNTLEIKYGTYFWLVHLPYSYALILACLGILLFEMNRVSHRFRTQIILLFGSICIPIAINLINLSGLVKGTNLNPLGFLCFLSVSALGIFRFQLLRGSPIAYETVFHTSPDGVIILNEDSVIMDINPAAADGLGKTPEKLIGNNVNDVFANWAPFSSVYEKDIEQYKELELEMKGSLRYFSISKQPVINRDGDANGQILTIRNITTQKLHQISLETLAFHDPLTMLGNRRKFDEEFAHAVEGARKSDRKFAVLYFDLNSFKAINDTLGHKIGDELLKHVAARIASILRKPDVVARLGGDEFAAILHNATERGVKTAVERIVDNTKTPFRVKGHTLVAELSVGAAFYPEDGTGLRKLLNRADTAMYRAKSNGGGLALFDSSVDSARILHM